MIPKGGVGKTVSSVNFAYILATIYNKKVLLVDLDPQGNTTKAYGVTPNRLTVSDLLLDKNAETSEAIYSTEYENIKVIPADISLIKANQAVLLDSTSVQQTRLKKHIKKVSENFDFCIFDCPTDFSMSTLNAFAASDDVLVPVHIDQYSFDAITKVQTVVENMEDFNDSLKIAGCFVTMYQSNNLNKQGLEVLQNQKEFKTFKTVIRHTVRASESTYDKPLCDYAPKSTAAEDYRNLVKEYLNQ